MGVVNFTAITDGTTADASDVNSIANTIYNEFNGNIEATNLASGAVTTAKIADGAVTYTKLETPVAFYAKMSASQTLSTATSTTIEFNIEGYDYGGNFDPSTYTFTAPYNGIYSFSAMLRFSGIDDAKICQVSISTSNTGVGAGGTFTDAEESVAASDTVYPGINVSSVELSAGDTVVVKGEHNNGTSQDVSAANEFVWFMGHLVGRTG